MTHMVRVEASLHARLSALAQAEGETMGGVLEKAVRAYEERAFWESVNASYAAAKADPVAWQQEQEERRLWEGTLADDLEDDPYPMTADGKPVPR